MSNSSSATDEIRQFVERIESLQAEKTETARLERETFAEAKGRGYDIKVLRRLISERRRDSNEVAEEEAVLEMYRSALGMSYSLKETASDDIAGMV